MKFKQLILFFFVLISVCTHADELNDKQQLIEKNLLLETKALNSKFSPSSVSKTCLTAPLPRTPKTPNYSMKYEKYNESIGLIFWREPCKDNTGSALLVRANPILGNPFLCSPSFKIIQNSNQLNDIKVQSTPDGGSWCDDLFIESTLIVNQYEFGEMQFNPAKTLTVIYEDKKLFIPAGSLPKPSINGSAVGYKNFSFTCKNTKTGAFKAFPSQTGTGWNCNGLTVKSGDTVQTTIKGTVQ